MLWRFRGTTLRSQIGHLVHYLGVLWHHKISQGDRSIIEEAKGFLSYRVADRRGDILNHRGYRNSNLLRSRMARERGLGSRFPPHHQHGGSYLATTYNTIGFGTLTALGGAAPCTTATSAAACLL